MLKKKQRLGSIDSVVDWMEADLNVSLQSIVRKGWNLSRLNDALNCCLGGQLFRTGTI